MDNKVFKYSEFTKENTYKIGIDGKFEKQEWSYYKDVYPERYNMVDGEKQLNSFCWIIKQNDTKMVVLSDKLSEDCIKSIMETLSKSCSKPELIENKEQENN